MKKNSPWFVIGIIVLLSLACSFSAARNQPQPTPLPAQNQAAATVLVQSTPTFPPLTAGSMESEQRLIALYHRVSPGVVAIRTTSQAGGGLGSGFIYDSEGHIITNYHVVEGAEDLEVDFQSGLKTRGQVVGTDLDSDLAIVQVDVPPNELHPLTMGDSDLLQVGQTLVAIGNPFGLTGTMTVGILSAKGRTLNSLHMTTDGTFYSAGDLLQTDASINPGNSGGPLLNLDGEVIGINRAIRTTGVSQSGDPVNSGIGFAVSINIVKRVTPEIIQNGSFDYPYLGVSARPELTLQEVESLGLSQSTGAYVVDVVPGSPADEAGLQAGSRDTDLPGVYAGGDLIVGIDGRPVLIFGDLLSYIMLEKSPGDQVSIQILRDNDVKEVMLTLGKRP